MLVLRGTQGKCGSGLQSLGLLCTVSAYAVASVKRVRLDLGS